MEPIKYSLSLFLLGLTVLIATKLISPVSALIVSVLALLIVLWFFDFKQIKDNDNESVAMFYISFLILTVIVLLLANIIIINFAY